MTACHHAEYALLGVWIGVVGMVSLAGVLLLCVIPRVYRFIVRKAL